LFFSLVKVFCSLKNLDKRLRSLIRTETSNSETKGQLEFLLNLLCKGGDQVIEQTSDNEEDNDEVSDRLEENPQHIVIAASAGRSGRHGSRPRSGG
jgi:hypothetical protein